MDLKPLIVKLFFVGRLLSALVIFSAVWSCAPKEPVVFKEVKNIAVDLSDGKPVLRGDVFLYNPNRMKMKLKEINVLVTVDGNPSAEVKHRLDVAVPARADFSVPLVAQLTLKQSGLLDTVVGLLGGRKYEVVFTGYLRIAVHGVTIKVPIAQKQELKLNL